VRVSFLRVGCVPITSGIFLVYFGSSGLVNYAPNVASIVAKKANCYRTQTCAAVTKLARLGSDLGQAQVLPGQRRKFIRL
jgi:hypothetical protein